MKNPMVLVCVLMVTVMSCRSGTPKEELLVPDSMKVIMWDMMRADEIYLRILAKDTTADDRKENIRLYEQVFALHKITKKQFDSSYRYYASHPNLFKRLLDSLDTYAISERSKLFKKKYGGANKESSLPLPQ